MTIIALANEDDKNSFTVSGSQLVLSCFPDFNFSENLDPVISIVSQPNCKITENYNGTWTFTPNANFNQRLQFELTVLNGPTKESGKIDDNVKIMTSAELLAGIQVLSASAIVFHDILKAIDMIKYVTGMAERFIGSGMEDSLESPNRQTSTTRNNMMFSSGNSRNPENNPDSDSPKSSPRYRDKP